VVGESGSGKSTLALAALGLLKHRGELKVDGKGWAVDRASDLALRRTMQVVFQDPFSSLSPRMTVEQIVGEGLRVHAPELDTKARRARSLAALADVGLTEAQFPALLDRYPHEFSGGPAAAAGDRARPDRRSATAGARRADQRARRDDPEAGAGPAAAPAAGARAELPA
jgi:ABC-type microcin C transport system duplicated ATPase subunit YejF